MKIQDLDFKKMKLITNYENITKLLQNTFSSKGMLDYMYKNYYYFKINNDSFLQIRKYNSFGFCKSIYYNDMKKSKAPEKKIENFIFYQDWDFKNFNENAPNYYTLVQICSKSPYYLFTLDIFNDNTNYWNIYNNYKKDNKKLLLLNYEWVNCKAIEKNIINEDLIHDIITVLNFNNSKMIIRLKKYFTRFYEQIEFIGYYGVNRQRKEKI